ncbi:GtrA family protein [Paenibacillus thailandensis]|uniref:GtrA family protein n=1 Tax=Paenibacillus thailandensis TaxID=393250 RepID=A0ABW5R2F5_9BACL
MPENKRSLLVQFVAFNFIGLMNTAVDYIVFQALIWAGVHYIVAQVISYAAGTVNSFVMNRAVTFKHASRQAGRTRAQAARFAVLNAGVMLCSIFLLYVFVDLGGLPYWLSKLLVTAVTVVLNFTGSKRWVFREERAQVPR